jgi:shikimate dehydrogenase
MVTDDATTPPAAPPVAQEQDAEPAPATTSERPREFGGPAGLEPTRYGDWERKGRCVDF